MSALNLIFQALRWPPVGLQASSTIILLVTASLASWAEILCELSTVARRPSRTIPSLSPTSTTPAPLQVAKVSTFVTAATLLTVVSIVLGTMGLVIIRLPSSPRNPPGTSSAGSTVPIRTPRFRVNSPGAAFNRRARAFKRSRHTYSKQPQFQPAPLLWHTWYNYAFVAYTSVTTAISSCLTPSRTILGASSRNLSRVATTIKGFLAAYHVLIDERLRKFRSYHCIKSFACGMRNMIQSVWDRPAFRRFVVPWFVVLSVAVIIRQTETPEPYMTSILGPDCFCLLLSWTPRLWRIYIGVMKQSDIIIRCLAYSFTVSTVLLAFLNFSAYTPYISVHFSVSLLLLCVINDFELHNRWFILPFQPVVKRRLHIFADGRVATETDLSRVGIQDDETIACFGGLGLILSVFIFICPYEILSVDCVLLNWSIRLFLVFLRDICLYHIPSFAAPTIFEGLAEVLIDPLNPFLLAQVAEEVPGPVVVADKSSSLAEEDRTSSSWHCFEVPVVVRGGPQGIG